MKTGYFFILFLILALWFVSCQTTQEIDEQLVQPQTPPVGFAYNNEESLVHSESGAVFPIYLANFLRGNVHIYDDRGSNISVGYSLNKPPAEVTIYIYPTYNTEGIEVSLEEEFENVNSTIETLHPDAYFAEKMYTKVTNFTPEEGMLSVCGYTDFFREKPRYLTSSTILYKKDGWFIKFRITYPPKQHTFDEIDKLLRTFDYSSISSKSKELYSTASSGDSRQVKRLIEKGVDVNAKVSNGATALMGASYGGHTEVVKLLLEAGADVNIQEEMGWTALLTASVKGYSEIVELLIVAEADVNANNEHGDTALIWASVNGYSEIVKLLIESGADVNDFNNEGITPLMFASQYGYTEVAQLLIEAGAKE